MLEGTGRQLQRQRRHPVPMSVKRLNPGVDRAAATAPQQQQQQQPNPPPLRRRRQQQRQKPALPPRRKWFRLLPS